MKSKFRTMFLGLLFIGITFAFSSSSCKKDPTTTCITATGCQGKSYKSCAGITGGYYEYNGIQYKWSGTDPTAAATNLAHAMGCK
jgi:hypothetical protein